MARPKKVPDKVQGKFEMVDALFQDLRAQAPKVFEAIRGEAVGCVMGSNADAIKAVLKTVGEDVISFRAKTITSEAFEAKLEERRSSIFRLFPTDRVSRCKPTDQKVLDSVARLVGIIWRTKSL